MLLIIYDRERLANIQTISGWEQKAGILVNGRIPGPESHKEKDL